MRVTIGLLLVAVGMMATLNPATASVYQRGAFYIGSNCGGNPIAGAATVGTRIKAQGVILSDVTGVLIGGQMNCDDRRHAIGPYRDGLEGQIDQLSAWSNNDGGDSGSLTIIRKYLRDGYSCRDFREIYNSSGQVSSDNGSACLQGDGNWHIL